MFLVFERVMAGVKISQIERDVAKHVAITTTTLFNADNPLEVERAEITIRMITAALERDYNLSVVDGGSDAKFLRALETLGVSVQEENPGGMATGRRQAFGMAYDTKRLVIIWTEPEKEPYVKEFWKTAEPILNGEADLTIGDRRPLDSYPKIQQLAEAIGNYHFKDATGMDLDVWGWRKNFNKRPCPLLY